MSEEEWDSEEAVVLPEISVKELAEWLRDRPDFVLLDVREPYEFTRVKINDPRVVYAPMSELARKYLDALPAPVRDKSAAVAVICHHGNRSAQVTYWLQTLGWEQVVNVAGGIDAYARQVDPQVGMY